MKLLKKFARISNIGILNLKHIVIYGVLCLFILVVQSQIRPGQLRNEVLKSQQPPTTVKPPTKKSARALSRSIKAANPSQSLAPIINPLANKNATLVYLENAETLTSDKLVNADIQILKGNVRFRHDNALLYCDSAYFYNNANSLDAFGNVRIIQADTVFIFGDVLFYDGNQKLARLRQNVRMENRKTTLTTDSLNYDRNSNFAYYYTGGKIVDSENTLTSIWGQYSTQTNQAVFKNQVHLVNKNFTMDADSMHYNTKSNIANLVSPTHIIYQEETDIFSNKGWYNTKTEQMMLLNRSLVKHKDGQTIVGDTVFYDKIKNFGEGFTNVILNDTAQKTTLYGDYVYYNEDTEVGLATDSALLVDWSSKDTMYVHADTLRTYKDSIYDVARGFYNVRIYRNDVQGLCDSLVYSARDSVMNMYGRPVLWTETNQLSGDFIKAITKNSKVEQINILDNSMAVQREDSVNFNQLSGKEIIAYVDSGQLSTVHVNGNAETIYFPKDDKDSTLIGMNKTESSFVVLHFKDKKVERIVLTSESKGTMFPMEKISTEIMYMKNFYWLEKLRPKNPQDLFSVYSKQEREEMGVESLPKIAIPPTTESSKNSNLKSADKKNPSSIGETNSSRAKSNAVSQ